MPIFNNLNQLPISLLIHLALESVGFERKDGISLHLLLLLQVGHWWLKLLNKNQQLIKMSNMKIGVEVVSSHDLASKDGQGSANPCVDLKFDNQKFRTAIKEKDLNPHWNEQFYFNISDPSSLPNLSLEAYVYHINRNTNSKTLIGKVPISGTSFVPLSEATALHYPLEKPHNFSRTRGELCLKVFLTENPSTRPYNPLTDLDPFPTNPPHGQAYQSEPEISIPNSTSAQFKEKRTDSTHTFNHF
ncbi:hypothetical protein IEQ34_012982 [Dendrobium chrysotoxum]|uniref:C2 domain-containing protein n=1 Tax=Dendrobium chrysotoxum TaxID=161865 RepID=A0AAV7GQ27_DENCH|nr:hypothetical protein IEQ34_012982 [Dendrobium chrysotoxum]